MGVPGFFAWIIKHFKNRILTKTLPKNTDILYIDANCLFHPECYQIIENVETTDIKKLENMMFERIINYLDYLEKFINPKLMFIAVDGVAPLAKMEQQRKRRFKSCDDLKMKNKIKQKYNIRNTNPTNWNNIVITPGTEFMEKLHQKLLEHYFGKNFNDKSTKYIYSSYHTHGEGEHKILQHLKSISSNNQQVVIYGLDADLIFLSLASHRRDIYLLREEMHFGPIKQKRKINDPVKDVAEDLIFVSIDETLKSYNFQIQKMTNSLIYTNFNDDFIDDFIFICFLLGNDFLPHFPSIDIKNGGLDEILDAYVNTYCQINQKLICLNGQKVNINMAFLMIMFVKLGEREHEYFRNVLINKNNKSKRHVCSDEYSKELWMIENLEYFEIEDKIKLGYGDQNHHHQRKFKYYENFYGTCEHQKEFVDSMIRLYLEGINWVTKYYFESCPTWRWQYTYHHAPFISDVVNFLEDNDFDINLIKFDNQPPVDIMTQLISVIPSDYANILPQKYQKLVTNSESPIIDLFPKNVQLDMINKNYYWQCIPLIPYLEIDRIIEVVKNIELSNDEKKRNQILDIF